MEQMKSRGILAWVFGLVLVALFFCAGCGKSDSGADPQLAAHGSIEVTAKLVEVPAGAIFRKDLYDYATVLKYELVQVHRGTAPPRLFYVAHYDPFKPRNQAADKFVKDIGGNLSEFVPGQLQRMALQVPVDDYYMGGLVNKYFGQETGPIYWAVWTNQARQ